MTQEPPSPSLENPSLEPRVPGWRYSPASNCFDEVAIPGEGWRPHWKNLLTSLETMGQDELARRWREGRRLIHDNGVTYNVYGDPRAFDRPWPMDPIPFVLDRDEWAHIEAGIAQRATLLDRILADLYGHQRLIRDRSLPAELVFGNPAFLRACHGISLPGDTYLHLYAADLARSPDGRWWVIADRTQAPSGSGYTLENRMVSSRTLPDVFGEAQVQRLAPFFQSYRDNLMALAPRHRDNPRVVLLTPGPYNETYFEHAYLARYLGFTLVEGGDLLVRDSRVFLKTLAGLLPVDVIVRRQDDSFCDPLELRPDSMLGIPGLMHAVRSGNVAVANALGSGLLETAATSAFLDPLCQQLLGEELKIPSVATWWCGQPPALAQVLSNLENLVIKPAFPSGIVEPVFGGKLSRTEREELALKLQADPIRFVAQEQVALSSVPIWGESGLIPRRLVIRVYAAAFGKGYHVMPGGLTRISASPDSLIVSVQRGGGSKDTWVLAGGPVPQFTLLRQPGQPIDVNRATFDLPSRVADNLFWLGRYLERVESGVRMVRAVLPSLSQDLDTGSAARAAAGAGILVGMGYITWEGKCYDQLAQESIATIFDDERRGGIAWTATQIRRVAWLLRDRLSADAWRVLNRLESDFMAPQPAVPPALLKIAAIENLNRSIVTLSAFSGLVMESMTRGQGWRFLDIGRRLERAMQVIELLRHGLVQSRESETYWFETLLEIADSAITYRSRYLTTLQADLIADLLLVDEGNPRSAAFQLARLSEHIEMLPDTQAPVRRRPESRAVLSALTTARLAEVETLTQVASGGRREELDRLLTRVASDVSDLSNLLTRAYLSHSAVSRPLL